MKTKIIFTTMAAATLLAACEASEENTPQPTYDNYVDVRKAAAAVTPGTQALPTNDSVTMNGAYEIISTDLLGSNSIVGEMRMTADFGNETVDGSMHNNYVDMDGSANKLTGEVEFSGDIAGSSLYEVHGDGILTTVSGDKYDMYVDLDGTFGNSSLNGVNITDGALSGNIDVLTDDSIVLYDVMTDSDFAVAECLDVPDSSVCTP